MGGVRQIKPTTRAVYNGLIDVKDRMSHKLTQEDKEVILALYEDKEASISHIANIFGVTRNTIYRVVSPKYNEAVAKHKSYYSKEKKLATQKRYLERKKELLKHGKLIMNDAYLKELDEQRKIEEQKERDAKREYIRARDRYNYRLRMERKRREAMEQAMKMENQDIQ